MNPKPSPKQPAAVQEFYRRSDLVVMDEEDATRQELRQAAISRLDKFWIKALRIIAQYDGNKLMMFDCFLLAIGQGEMIGLQTAVEVAKKHSKDIKVNKAAASKIIGMFRTCLNIPLAPGQRDLAGCDKMSDARKKQLKGKQAK